MGGGEEPLKESHDSSDHSQTESANAQSNVASNSEQSTPAAPNLPNDSTEANKPEENSNENVERVGPEQATGGAPVTEPTPKSEDIADSKNTQQAIDVNRINYEKNLEFEMSIKQEEAGKTPLVCLPEGIEKLYQEYEQGSDVYRNKILKLAENHHKIRRCRGDGNCFYRAFGFAWFERLMVSKNQTLRRAALESLVATNSLLKSAGYDPLVFDDIYDLVEEKMKAVANGEYDDVILLTIFQTDEVSNRIVWYLRIITAAYLKVHREEYEPFLEFEVEMDQYCRKYVEVMEQEADHIHVIALTKALKVPVEVAYMSGSNALEQVNFHEFYPDEAAKGDVTLKPLVLLYRPGHYDILYRRE